MLDLLSHCKDVSWVLRSIASQERRTRQYEENHPVHDQDRPENWNVEYLKPAAEEGNGDGPGGRVPELELRQSPDEGSELLVLLGRKRADRAVFHIVIQSLVNRVELGLQEGEEKIEQVNPQGISDCLSVNI